MEWFLKKITQKLDSFGEALFFYPVANTFSQMDCQIPYASWLQPFNLFYATWCIFFTALPKLCGENRELMFA